MLLIKTRYTTFRILLLAASLLTLPALLINLGVMPYTSDEPTRGIVTLEMIYSANYITPTFTGEYYYNKPPLFNWILAPFIVANGGSAPEWLLRLPSILALLGFSFTIFLFTRRYFGKDTGLLAALLFLTCGRILFWDSMLGLIDILYSWVTFSGFVVIINNAIKGDYRKLFLFSYLLTATGFMLKGMPSIVFQGVSLLAVFLAMKNFRKLFSLYHFAGIAIFMLIAGTYLFLYSKENSLQQYLSILWDQSSQRTAVRKGFSDTIKHLVVFHPEMIYHFLPWSGLSVLLLLRRSRKLLFNGFYHSEETEMKQGAYPGASIAVRLMIILFLANIIVYWLSPATIPRYVLMLAPLTFIPLLLLFLNPDIRNSKLHKVLSIVLYFVAPGALVLVFSALKFLPGSDSITNITVISVTATTVMLIIYYFIIRFNSLRLPLLIISLLLLRVVFNITWLPAKAMQVPEYHQKTDALEIASISQDSELKIIGKTWMDHSSIMYITSERGVTLSREYESFKAEAFYLTDKLRLDGLQRGFPVPYIIHDSTFIKHKQGVIYLISFETDFTIP